MIPTVIAYIAAKLRLQWAPEQISGVIESDPDGPGTSVSHETIYRFIWDNKQCGGTLYTELRQGHKKRRKRRGSKDSRGKIKNRVDIDRRPAVVETRSRVGDWEADLVCGTAASGYLVTLLERVSHRVLIGYTKTKFADKVTAEQIALVENRLNTRPRKCLGFKPPNIVYFRLAA